MKRALGLAVAATLGIGAGYFLGGNGTPRAAGQPAGGPVGMPKYTVVETDILSALVVDNSTNTVFFYTVDAGAEPGSDLHLRGSLDLNEVGKPVLKPKKAAGLERAKPAADK